MVRRRQAARPRRVNMPQIREVPTRYLLMQEQYRLARKTPKPQAPPAQKPKRTELPALATTIFAIHGEEKDTEMI